MIPGEYQLSEAPIEINVGRQTNAVRVENTGDRPIQVGSHCHFFECNASLRFTRTEAYGMRLNIPAGTAVRFEPGDTREVELVELGGNREVLGLNLQVEGLLDMTEVRQAALHRSNNFVR